jgi:hypothetical protein
MRIVSFTSLGPGLNPPIPRIPTSPSSIWHWEGNDHQTLRNTVQSPRVTAGADSAAAGINPFAALPDRRYVRAESARKRSSVEGVGCAKWGHSKNALPTCQLDRRVLSATSGSDASASDCVRAALRAHGRSMRASQRPTDSRRAMTDISESQTSKTCTLTPLPWAPPKSQL